MTWSRGRLRLPWQLVGQGLEDRAEGHVGVSARSFHMLTPCYGIREWYALDRKHILSNRGTCSD